PIRREPPRRPGARLWVETLETREMPAAFTAGDLLLIQAAASANNSTASLIELSPTTPGSGVQALSIRQPAGNDLRVSGSAGTTLPAARTTDDSLSAIAGAYSSNTSSNANTLTARSVVTVDAYGNFNTPATYTGSSGNQARGATSLNDSTW